MPFRRELPLIDRQRFRIVGSYGEFVVAVRR
jgi:hypothetical protein